MTEQERIANEADKRQLLTTNQGERQLTTRPPGAGPEALTRYKQGQQNRCPHRVTTGSLTPSRQILHSKYESSPVARFTRQRVCPTVRIWDNIAGDWDGVVIHQESTCHSAVETHPVPSPGDGRPHPSTHPLPSPLRPPIQGAGRCGGHELD